MSTVASFMDSVAGLLFQDGHNILSGNYYPDVGEDAVEIPKCRVQGVSAKAQNDREGMQVPYTEILIVPPTLAALTVGTGFVEIGEDTFDIVEKLAATRLCSKYGVRRIERTHVINLVKTRNQNG